MNYSGSWFLRLTVEAWVVGAFVYENLSYDPAVAAPPLIRRCEIADSRNLRKAVARMYALGLASCARSNEIGPDARI